MKPISRAISPCPVSPTPLPDVLAIAEGLAALVRLAELAPRLEVALARLERAPTLNTIPTARADFALSVAELCRRAGISKALAYKMIADGSLASVTIGRRRLIPAAAARDFLARGSPS